MWSSQRLEKKHFLGKQFRRNGRELPKKDPCLQGMIRHDSSWQQFWPNRSAAMQMAAITRDIEVGNAFLAFNNAAWEVW